MIGFLVIIFSQEVIIIRLQMTAEKKVDSTLNSCGKMKNSETLNLYE